jgi:nucleotide-binding universal stress UspA family protein
VAVDGSKPSLDAAGEAINLAQKYGATLVVLHIISSDIRYNVIFSNTRYGKIGNNIPSSLSGPLKEIWSKDLEKGQKYVDEVKARVSDKTLNAQTEVIVAANSVVKEIVDYADKQEVDLIVIGTRGMTGIKRMLLGSTASGVVTYAQCPVLVVK